MATDIGALCDALYALNGEISEVHAKLKELGAHKNQLEAQLLDGMRAIGVDLIRGKTATVSISEVVRPQIADWDKFEYFVLRKKALHMLERRIASKAYREMKELLHGRPVPGLTEFVQTTLNVRKVA